MKNKVCGKCRNKFGSSYKYIEYAVENADIPKDVKYKIIHLLKEEK